jgi:hypothetical protein
VIGWSVKVLGHDYSTNGDVDVPTMLAKRVPMSMSLPQPGDAGDGDGDGPSDGHGGGGDGETGTTKPPAMYKFEFNKLVLGVNRAAFEHGRLASYY